MLVDRDDAQVIALKPAFQGNAVVVRLASFAPAAVEVRLSCPSRPIRKATLCDARERAYSGLTWAPIPAGPGQGFRRNVGAYSGGPGQRAGGSGSGE
jgi:alpha-mannosidase